MPVATARFDLKMDAAGKDLLARAAALMGTTMAGLVRAAARKERVSTVMCWSRTQLRP